MKRSKAIVTFEDSGKSAVTCSMLLDHGDAAPTDVSLAAVCGLATRVIYRSGLLMEIGMVALEAINAGDNPDEAVYNHLKGV